MTFIVAILLGALAILAAAIAGLLVQRRALRESVEQFRIDYLNGFCEQVAGMEGQLA